MGLVIAGVVLLVIAAACVYGARHQRQKVNQLESGETFRCGDVGEALVGRVCEVAGLAQPGPEGPVTGPQSGRQGVWFAHKVTRHWVETRADDNDADHRRERVRRHEVVRQSRSDAPFVVDDGSGPVTIAYGDYELEDVGGLQKSEERGGPPEGYDRGGMIGKLGRLDDHGEYFEYEEWVMPAGTKLFVSGEVGLYGDSLGIGKPQNGQLVISAKSEEELIRGGERNEKLFQVAAGVAAIAGVGLIVAGLVT